MKLFYVKSLAGYTVHIPENGFCHVDQDQTTTTHYHIQKKRRAEFIDEWRKYRQTVIRKEDVTLVPTARGLRTGVYMGWDGDSADALPRRAGPRDRSRAPTPPSTATPGTRMLFMVEGAGWTEVDGVRYDWKPWDAIHIPAWSWHRHGNDGDKVARFMSYSSSRCSGRSA